jgi:hypothetical protein
MIGFARSFTYCLVTVFWKNLLIRLPKVSLDSCILAIEVRDRVPQGLRPFTTSIPDMNTNDFSRVAVYR